MKVSAAFPSSLTPENREVLKKTLLGWFRFRDHQRPKEESYVLDVSSVMGFIFGEGLVKTRESLISGLGGFKSSDSVLSEFRISNVNERVLAVKALEMPDVLDRVLEERNIAVLAKYFEDLSRLAREFSEKKLGSPVLIEASLAVLAKCLFLLGVI